jgi:hypothetical protein
MSAKEKRGIEHNRSGYDSLVRTMGWWSETRHMLELDCTIDVEGVLSQSLEAIDAINAH